MVKKRTYNVKKNQAKAEQRIKKDVEDENKEDVIDEEKAMKIAEENERREVE